MKKQLLLLATALCSLTAMAQVPSYVPTNGLIGWWPFNGNANDESGNGNNATTTNATITSDRNSSVNSAYSFNGTSNFIEIPDSPPLRLNNTDFTISFWVNVNTFNNGSNATAFLFKRGGGSFNGWVIDANSGDSYSVEYVVSSGSDPQVNSSSIINTNIWHNVLIRYTLATQNITFYYDGVLDSSPSSILPTPNSSCSSVLRFGWDTGSPTNPYWLDGKLDDIGIWNRALTPCEITNLYQASSNTIIAQPTNQTANINTTAQFYVTSSNASATYQWQQNSGTGFVNLSNFGQFSGVTNDTLKISNVTLAQSNYGYRCIINGGCPDTSSVAMLTVNNNVGVVEVNNTVKNVTISPNPFTSQTVITFSTEQKNTTVKIIDVVGKEIKQELFSGKQLTIEKGELNNGIYFVQITDENKNTIIKKIVIQ